MRLRFTTVTGNSGSPQANLYTNNTANAILYADGRQPTRRAAGTNCGGSPAFTSWGYNRVSDDSCALAGGSNDLTNAAIQLKPLGAYGGPTLTHLPAANDVNPILDVVPRATCEGFFTGEGLAVLDQRGMPRPRLGKRGQGAGDPEEAPCDAGAVELGYRDALRLRPAAGRGQRVQRALPGADHRESRSARRCPAIPSSSPASSRRRCWSPRRSRSAAPRRMEATPGTHMGIVQAGDGRAEQRHRAASSSSTGTQRISRHDRQPEHPLRVCGHRRRDPELRQPAAGGRDPLPEQGADRRAAARSTTPARLTVTNSTLVSNTAGQRAERRGHP